MGNLGVANDFNVFLLGDHIQSFASSEGRVAVGGNAVYKDYDIGSKLPAKSDRADLIVKKNLDISGGNNFNGCSAVCSTGMIINYTMKNPNGVMDKTLPADPVNFTAAESYLKSYSLYLSSIPATGIVSVNFGQIVLTGSNPTLNVFSFDGSNVAQTGLTMDKASVINIIAPDNSTIIINVNGDNIGFGDYTIFRNSLPATTEESRYILWNFYGAMTAFNRNVAIKGSILAPYTNWKAIGFGTIDGTIVANSLVNSGGSLEEHLCLFYGNLPSASDTVEALRVPVTNVASKATEEKDVTPAPAPVPVPVPVPVIVPSEPVQEQESSDTTNTSGNIDNLTEVGKLLDDIVANLIKLRTIFKP